MSSAESTTRPVTGEQYEIRHGAVRAVATEVGAGLRVFEVDGVPYLHSFSEHDLPPFGAGTLLAPWPNRVADGRWEWEGEPQQLTLSEPARHNAIHGLLRQANWLVVERTEARVELTSVVNRQAGWPVPLRVGVAYEVGPDGLTITHTATNIGSGRSPFGVASHPFPRAGLTPTLDCTLTMPAHTVLPVDDRLLPTGPAESVEGTKFDFRAGRPMREVTLDTAFGDCRPDETGFVRHNLIGPDGAGVQVWAEPVFNWVQVFTPDDLAGQGPAVAIEAMTCPPDALNSGVDLIWLEPGETWQGSWGVKKV
ncbi:aldose 1-epimerase family protein [Actinoalloteichus hymeniacidonis]|uniref:Galactose mutarotase-like enzyme n=1 Tax=Actinoalloteichus hymeniacidonis TaxID=340345 RepID=A0AAC9HU84_9PSEU|nr:aldose 1-epimerase family protein [Actinoalloteichus hymeniacidonis]AOS65802.1 galactose mutarotase-like enzyme [Actinoalloteichus hymeniacidonis]MBB5906107.1 aldose 1-epimerase [Actinoalloteichus hymeniacidonis]